MTAAGASITAIAAAERLVEELLDRERASITAAIPLGDRVDEIDAAIDANTERRRREKLQAAPDPRVLRQCDEQLRELKVEREAAEAARVHAGRGTEEAREARLRAEAELRALHFRVPSLRAALPRPRHNLADTRSRLSEARQTVEMLTRREAIDAAKIAETERELAELVGGVDEPSEPTPYMQKPIPGYTS